MAPDRGQQTFILWALFWRLRVRTILIFSYWEKTSLTWFLILLLGGPSTFDLISPHYPFHCKVLATPVSFRPCIYAKLMLILLIWKPWTLFPLSGTSPHTIAALCLSCESEKFSQSSHVISFGNLPWWRWLEVISPSPPVTLLSTSFLTP